MSEELFRSPGGTSKKVGKSSPMAQEIFEWVEMVAVSFCFVVILFTFVIRPAVVVGESMMQTLQDGEALLISPLADDYAYKDIVVFQIPENVANPASPHRDPIIKRVIATEGQWVDVDLVTWKVYVADTKEALATAEPLGDPYEPYINYIDGKTLSAAVTFPLEVPKGCLFVMGDNRSYSYDSRSFGCIGEDWIMGKVLCRLLPIDKFGKIGS